MPNILNNNQINPRNGGFIFTDGHLQNEMKYNTIPAKF